MTQTITYHITRYCFITIGAVTAWLQPAVPFLLVCTFAVLLDCLSAWQLSRRVKKKYRANDGKFKSRYARRIIDTLLKIYAVILLTYMLETLVLHDFHLHLPHITAGIFTFVQLWSFLENESSENDRHWARLLQRIMVNKAKRHFDIDIEPEKDNKQP